MGYVYEAQHVGTGRRVALKVISTDDLTKNASLVARFHREAKAAGAIDTQHICQVLDTGTDPGSGLPFMVMEYMTGEDVQQLFERLGTLGPELSLKIIAQACLGLAKAHDAGVVHRDIKPANLFLTERDGGEVMVKLLDFGIAKVKMEQSSSMENAGLTRTGSILGSPLYMSPEQARGAKTIDHRADIYSLGVVLYQALAGRTPWHHIEALGELILSICNDSPAPVQDHAPWVPREVAAVVHKMLQTNPKDRYQNAHEVYEACKALLPSGTAIEKSMLVSLGDTQRELVAQRLTLPPPGTLNAGSSNPSMPPPAPASTQQIAAATNAGVAAPTERHPAVGQRSNTSLMVVGAVIGLLGAAAVAIFKFGGTSEANGGTNAAGVVAPPTSAPAPAPSESGAPAVEPAITPGPATERHVKVVIDPIDAIVEVDGKPAKVKNRAVDVSGPLGSRHIVKLSSGKFQIEEEVYITESGATPPMVALDVRTGQKVPAAKSTATPATAAPAVKTAPPPGIEDKFGD